MPNPRPPADAEREALRTLWRELRDLPSVTPGLMDALDAYRLACRAARDAELRERVKGLGTSFFDWLGAESVRRRDVERLLMEGTP